MLSRSAFTLIELLVVIAIIMVLSALILPFINIGQSSVDRNETKVLLSALRVALDRFEAETGAVPLPTGSSSDPESGSWYPDTNTGSWDKQQLVWRLTHKMSQAEKIFMTDEAQKVSLEWNPYQTGDYFKKHHNLKSATTRNTAHAKLDAALAKIESWIASEKGMSAKNYLDTYYYKLTIRWEEPASFKKGLKGDYFWYDWANSHLFSGRGYYKLQYMIYKGMLESDLVRRRYMTHPCLDLDDLDSKFIDDQTIVDAWENPLIYVAHSTPAIGEKRFFSGAYERSFIKPLGGRVPITDRNRDGSINNEDWVTEPPHEDLTDVNRDQKLDDKDLIDHNKDGKVDRDDWGNILYNSIPGRAASFFLGSAGGDGEFNCLPPESENDDNVLLIEDYNE